MINLLWLNISMQNIFKRHEKKYIITREQCAFLQERLARHMVIDRGREYSVRNLYYDTENWDIIRESMENPLYKEKLRLRFYDHFNCESQGFFELKKKFDGIVYKRRIAFSLNKIKNLRIREILSKADSQISREIGFFLNNREVIEKIFIAYKRTAYNGLQDKTLRVSFDKDIFFRLIPSGDFCQNLITEYYGSEEGCRILNKNCLIMEIKTSGAIPLWLTSALSENKIFPVSFSKYGTCYAKYVFNIQNPMEAVNAA